MNHMVGAVAVYFNENDVLLESQGRNVTGGAVCKGDEMHLDECGKMTTSRAYERSEKIAGVLCQGMYN